LNDPLPGGEHVAHEASRQVSAVLHRPAAVVAELVGPPDDREMIRGGRCLGGLGVEPSAEFVDGDDGVGALVRIDAEHDHGPVAFHGLNGEKDRSVGISQWGRCHALIKPRRPVRIVLATARRDLATEGTEWLSERATRRSASR
jgi:hypothetical protein